MGGFSFAFSGPFGGDASNVLIASASGDGLFGQFDQAISPDTLDYVDANFDGAWAETESSRTAVMMQLSIRYGEWFVDPDAGSRIPAMLEAGEPVLPAEIVDEARRALQLLVNDGVISDVAVAVGEFDSAEGRLQINISYTDQTSGQPVDLVATL